MSRSDVDKSHFGESKWRKRNEKGFQQLWADQAVGSYPGHTKNNLVIIVIISNNLVIISNY